MENIESFDFFKARRISEVLNGTFTFIRQEFIPLGRCLIFIVGPLMLIMAIINNYYFEEQMTPDPELIFSFDYWSNIGVLSILQFALIALMISVVNHYILLYVESSTERFNVQSVFNLAIRDFLPLFGISLAQFILLMLGFMFFLIPGIYLTVTLSLIFVIIIHEKINFLDAMTRSFNLIRDYWWFTFGLLILTWIIVYALQLLFQIPMLVIGAIYGFHDANPEVLADYSWWLAISTTLSYLSYGFYAIILVAMAIHYYSQREKKEATGLAHKIDSLKNE